MTTAEALVADPVPPRRRWLPWAAVAVVLAVLGYGLWWLLWSTPIEAYPGMNGSKHDVAPGEVVSVVVAYVCVDGTDDVSIEDVTVDLAGLTVTDFAVRRRPDPPAVGFGTGGGPLRQIASGWSRTFDVPCDGQHFAEIAADLTRGENGPAHTERFSVHWRSGVRSGVLDVPSSFTLCAAGQVDENCAEWPPPEWEPIPG